MWPRFRSWLLWKLFPVDAREACDLRTKVYERGQEIERLTGELREAQDAAREWQELAQKVMACPECQRLRK